MEEGLLYGGTRDTPSGDSTATAVVILSTFVAASGSLTYGFAVGYSSPAESGIMEDLGLSIAEYSTFGSLLTFGGMFGALISGKVSDLIGRRGAMWLMEIFCIIGWFAIIFAKGAWLLDIGRLSLGVGAGLHCYVAPVYVSEITPKNIRGGFTTAITFTVTCGFALMFFIGNFMTWRTLAFIGTIPCLIQVVGVFFIPESPRWLAKIGQEKKVEATLQRLRGKNADISQEAADIKDYTETVQRLSKSRFLDLFDRKYAHSLIVGVGLMLLVQFGGTDAISSYASSIFKAAGYSGGLATTMMAITQVTSAGACSGCLLAGLGFLLKEHYQGEELTAIFVLAGILIYSAFFSMGMGGTPWVIMSEIFPINIKGPGGSLVTLGNWFSSWIVTYAFNFAFEWSSAGVFFIFAIICCSLLVFVAKLVPETKGRTLEEIQASMTLLQ